MSALLFIIINVFSGIFQGVVGFGQGVIATPISLIFLNKGTVLTAMIMSGIVLNGVLARTIEAPIETKVFKPLLISSICGLPIGLIIVRAISVDALKLYSGTLAIVLTLIVMFAKPKISNPKLVVPVIGLVAGVLQTSTTTPGPVVIMLLAALRVPRDSMRKMLTTYYLIISLLSIGLYLAGGVFTRQGFVLGLIAAPFIVGAAYVGNRLAGYVPRRWYHTIALSVALLASGSTIYSVLF